MSSDMRIGQIDIYRLASSLTSNHLKTSWEEIDCNRLIDPTPYVDQFRLFNEDESWTLATCANRGRIPSKDTHLVLSQTVSTDILYVSYSCTEYGLTQCLIVAKGTFETVLFTGFSRLNPIDSYNRKKGESLAFYRALTESEAIILPNLSESLFASAV